MANSFNFSDFGIKTFTYANFCSTLDIATILNNAAIDKVATPLRNDKYKCKYVSSDMVHTALSQVNPDLYMIDDKIEFADAEQGDAVTRILNQHFRNIKGYMDELKSYERKCRAPKKPSRVSLQHQTAQSDDKHLFNSTVKDLAFEVLQGTSLNCSPGNSISVSDERIKLTMLTMKIFEISLN